MGLSAVLATGYGDYWHQKHDRPVKAPSCPATALDGSGAIGVACGLESGWLGRAKC